ncbi:hypothetical protein E2C01_015725 [Portunus trituberculatus]|uniref:Uncharacterized protein n=1 Tax=Portunus trituberculatus TaxID=210409 RepID=A0A5B7DNU8_PORTR|nr:hypothetical protein [Portunus trituberculatus]
MITLLSEPRMVGVNEPWGGAWEWVGEWMSGGRPASLLSCGRKPSRNGHPGTPPSPSHGRSLPSHTRPPPSEGTRAGHTLSPPPRVFGRRPRPCLAGIDESLRYRATTAIRGVFHKITGREGCHVFFSV